MPGGEDTLATLTNIMETQFGFTSTEWRCLLNAHGLGRAMNNNTGFARHWTITPRTLSNTYAATLSNVNIPWNPETGVTNPNFAQALSPHIQYNAQNAATNNRNLFMLKADIRAFWDADGVNDNCVVTHTSPGCAPLAQLSLIDTWASNPSAMVTCFNAAFQKMIQLGQANLKTPN